MSQCGQGSSRPIILLVLDLASVFLFSGIIFGWAPLNAILVDEGFYSTLCEAGERHPCEAQANALNLAFTIASTAVSIVAIPAGLLVDRLGPAVGTVLAGLLEVAGLVGIALSEDVYRRTQFDLFLYSVTIIAIGGSLTMFNAYALPFLFPRRSTVVIELTSCLFDASCIMFTFFKIAYDAGADFRMLWWVYTAVAAGLYVALLLAWMSNAAALRASRAAPGDAAADAEGATSPCAVGSHEAHAPPDGAPRDELQAGVVAVTSPAPLSSQPLGRQLRSLEFVAAAAYATVQITRSNLYLGAVGLINRQNAQAAHWPEGALASTTTLVGVIARLWAEAVGEVPLGFFAVPLIECALHRAGLLGTFLITSALGLAYNGLQLWPARAAQLAAAVCFAAFRAFLFSALSAWNAATFGPRSMGRVMGVMFFAAALANLSQAPLVRASLKAADFRPLAVGSMAASAPPTLLWLIVAAVHRRRRRRRRRCEAAPPPPPSASPSSAWAAPLLDSHAAAPYLPSDSIQGAEELHTSTPRPLWRSHSSALGAGWAPSSERG